MSEPQTSLMTTTALTTPNRLSMTAAERAHGRIMRAPDHGEDEGDGGSAGADDGADKGDQGADDQGADDKSLMTGGGGDDAGQDDDKGDKDADGAKEGDDADKDADKDKDGEKKDEEAKGPPEAYELTPPEGMEIDETLLAEVSPIFKEIGLSNEDANKLMPLAGKFAERLFGQQNDAFQAQATDWAKQAKADPVLGGKNWSGTESHIARVFDVMGEKLPPTTIKGEDGKPVKLTGADQVKQFKTLLDNTKLGNHPTLIRIFRFVGEQFGEAGDLARSDAAAPVKVAREEALYPNDVPKKEPV